MSMKSKWVTVDIDKLDTIFTLMDKINMSATRGLISMPEKDALLAAIKTEITSVIVPAEPEPEPPAPPAETAPTKPAEKSGKGSK